MLENFWRFCNPKFENWKNRKKWPRTHVKAWKTYGFIPQVFSARLETRPTAFHFFSFIKVPEMRPLSTFQSILSNGYHGNDDRYRNFDFSFGYVFPNSMTVQSFITIERTRNHISMVLERTMKKLRPKVRTGTYSWQKVQIRDLEPLWGGGTSIWGVHGGVPRVRVIF